MLTQSLVLGIAQVYIGSSVNFMVTLCAAAIATWFAQNRFWLAVQRYVMGLVLGVLAFKLLAQQRSTV